VNVSVDNTSSVEIGTAGHAAAGDITIDAGVTITAAGYLSAPSGAIVDNGIIHVPAESSLTLTGALAGTGQIDIGNGGSLSIGGATATSHGSIVFSGSGDVLTISVSALDGSDHFAPTISGLTANDAIDFQGAVTGAVYDSAGPGTDSGTLTLYDGSTAVATLTLTGAD
jgi:hypothetical protein